MGSTYDFHITPSNSAMLKEYMDKIAGWYQIHK